MFIVNCDFRVGGQVSAAPLSKQFQSLLFLLGGGDLVLSDHSFSRAIMIGPVGEQVALFWR